MTTTIPSLDDDRILRHVRIDGYRLLTWDTYRHAPTGQRLLGYAFWRDGELEPIFCAEDYGCAPSDPIDSDASLRGLLAFLTLRPGDTDSDYFEGYTERQHDFAATDAEPLSIYALEADTDAPAMPFVEVD